ncbi:Flp pilus assembly protein CpaB [bacterium E08(2017)]|nr:Flp pilus assembly protein CpaB [bacterium E08(2017)]
MKEKLIPIVSIVVGLVAFFLTMKYTRDKEMEFRKLKQDFQKRHEQINVMVANYDIPGGTVLRQKDLRVQKVFKGDVGDRAVEHRDGPKILGRKILFQIKEGEPVFWRDIEGGSPIGGGLASVIKQNMRAVSLSIGGAQAVSSMVRPNDTVDILGTFSFPSKKIPGEMETVTLTILQSVDILATGQEIGRDLTTAKSSGNSKGYSTVTVEVTPREAELLVFAQQMQGRLTLALRNPKDHTYETQLPEVNFEHITSKLESYNMDRQRKLKGSSRSR